MSDVLIDVLMRLTVLQCRCVKVNLMSLVGESSERDLALICLIPIFHLDTLEILIDLINGSVQWRRCLERDVVKPIWKLPSFRFLSERFEFCVFLLLPLSLSLFMY